MAETVTFELVSPERLLATDTVTAVTVPGLDGELTAMANHAPFLSALRPGYVVTEGGEGGRYFVTGGLVEIAAETVTVLAEEAVPEGEITAEWMRERVSQAEKAVENAGEDRRQLEAQKLADYRFHAEQTG